MEIQVKVKTKQQESKVLQTRDFEYTVWVKALPDKNKANKEKNAVNNNSKLLII